MEAIKALNEKVAGIVESGSNENGSWVKFADGTAICFGSVANQSNGLSTAIYPIEFTEMPCWHLTIVRYSSYTAANPPIVLTQAGIGEARIYCRKPDGSIETNTTISINWLAIGKWK